MAKVADKLDIKYTRPTRSGLEVEGNRQFKNINETHGKNIDGEIIVYNGKDIVDISN